MGKQMKQKRNKDIQPAAGHRCANQIYVEVASCRNPGGDETEIHCEPKPRLGPVGHALQERVNGKTMNDHHQTWVRISMNIPTQGEVGRVRHKACE